MSTDIKMTKQRALSIANLSNDLVSELKQYAEKTEGDLPEWLQAKIEQAYQLILSAYGTLQADEELEKALGHKYKKRVPYTNSKGKKAWKYFYDVANSLRGKTAFDDAHLVEGAKFQVVSAKGKEVHAHITKVVGDMVTYVLDDGADKGKVITKTKSAILKDMDKEHKIVDILQQKVKEKRADVKQAKQTGTAKQIQRLQEQADRLQTAINKLRGANNLAREELVKDIVEGKAPSRLPQATQEEFSKLKDMFNKLEKMEDTKTPTGRIKNFKQVKELREQIVEQVNLLGRPPHSNDRIDTALGARSANSASLGRILLSTVPSTKQSLIDFNHAERRAFFKEVKKIYERHTNSSEENNFETMPEVEGYTPTSQEQFKQDRKDLADKKETLNILKREYEGDSNRFGDGGHLTEEQYNQLKSKLEKEITDLEIKTNEAGFNLPSSIEELEDRMKSAFPQISNVGQWKDGVSIHIEFNSSEEAKEFKKVIRSYNDGGYIGDNDKRLYGLFPSRLIEVLRGYENKVKFEAKDQENNFETMPEVEPVDNFETMPEVEVQPSSFLSDEELDKKSIEELETLKSQESKRGDALTKLIYKEHDERTANLPEYKELEKVQAELKEIFRKMEEAEEANNEFDLTLLESEEDEKQEEASVLRGKISKLRDDLYKELAKKYKRDESDKYYDKLADLLSKKIKEKNESGEAEKQAKKKAERQAKQNAKREAENEAKRRNEENENKTFMLGQYNEEIDFSAFTKEQFDATKQQQESMLKQAKYDYENLKAKAKRSEFAVKAKLDQIVGRYASMIRRYELNLKRLNNFEQKNNFETMPEAKEKPLNETFKAGRKEASFFDIVKDNALYSAVQKGRFSQYFDRHLVDTGKEIEEALANSQPNEREKGLAKQRLLNAMNLDIHASKVQPSNLLVRLINGGYISKTDTREKITAKLNKLITEQRAIKELAVPAQDAVRRAEREEQDRQNERKEKLAFEPERKEEIIKKANRRLSNEMKGKLARRLERGGLTDEEKDKLVKFASMVEHKQLNKLISFLKSPKTNVAKSYQDFIELTKKADEKISTYNRNSRKNGGLVSLSIEEEEIAYNSRKNGLTTEKGWAIELPVERNDIKLITNDEENSLKLVVNGDKTQYGAGLTLFTSPNIPINLLRTRDGQRLLKQISEIPSFKTEEEFKKVQSTIKEKIDEIKNDLEWLQNKHPLSKSYAVRNVAFLWNQELTKNFSEQYEKEVKLAGLDTPEGARQFLIAEGELVEPFSDSPESKMEIPELDPRLTYYLDNLESIIEKNKREKKFAFGQLEGYMKLNGFLVSALENLKDGSPFKEELAKLREDFKTSLKEKDYTSSEIARNVQRIRMLLRREQLPIDLQDDSENFETMPDEVEQENNFETMPEVEAQPTQDQAKTKTNLYVGRERLDRLLSETETSGENQRANPISALPSIYDFKESVSTVEGRGKGAEIWYSGRLYNEMLKIINRRDSSGLKDIIEEFKDANALLAKQAIATLDTDMIPVLRDAGTPTGSKSKEAKAEYNQFKTEYLEKIESANETNVPSDVQVIEYLRDKTLARLQGSLKQQAQDFLNAQIEKRKADSKPARKTAREELEESALTTPEGLTEKQVKAYRDQANLNESQIKEAGSKMEIQENENIHEPQGKLKSADSLSKKQKALFDKIIDKKGYRQVTRQINITNTGLMYSTNGRTIVMTNLEEFEPSGDQTMTEDFLRNTVGYDNERKQKMVTLNAKTVKSLNGKIKSLTKGKEAKKKYKVIEFEPNENTGKLDMLLSSEEGEAEPILLASIENESTSLYGQAIEVKDFQRLLNLGEDITISQKTREAQDPAYAPLHFGTDALEGYIMPLKLYNR
jgi:hypothetical protein